MLVVHPASLCDVCLDPYIISPEPTNSPHAIACGHIFCLTCLRNLSPSACPLCRKSFQPDRVKKLHVAGPPELGDAAEEAIGGQANELLQRVALVSGEDTPDTEIIDVVTDVETWLSEHSSDPDSYKPLRAAVATLQRYKALQDQNQREHMEYRRARRELKAYRRNADQDSKTSRAVEESLLNKIDEMREEHALELSHLQAVIDSLRRDTQARHHNPFNPLPPPPEPLPFERFPAFARPGGATDSLLGAIPYPPPPPRLNTATTNGHPTAITHSSAPHTAYVPAAQIPQQPVALRPRHVEAPRLDERSWRPSAQEGDGVDRHQERRPHAESGRTPFPNPTADTRYSADEGRSHIVPGAPPSQRVVPSIPSPTPSWAHHPLVEERRSDEERDVRKVHRMVRQSAGAGDGSDADTRSGVEARLVSAAAYIQGYGSGYDSGVRVVSEPATFAPSSFGSDRSERAHAFPVRESPDQAISGLGLMGVPRPIAPGTISTPDEDATPMNRARRLSRRNTTQVADTDRSTRRLGDNSFLGVPPNGVSRRVASQTVGQGSGIRPTPTGGTSHNGANGTDNLATHRRVANGIVAPLSGENESPRSETTWGTVQTLSSNGISDGSMMSFGMLLGLHNGGTRGQGSVASDSYVGREDLDDNITGDDEEGSGTETPIMTGSLPISHSASGTTIPSHRTTSSAERIPSHSGTPQDRQAHRARRNEGTNEHRRHLSRSTNAEVLHSNGQRAGHASDITNALSLHFDASLSTHDYQGHGHTFSAPSPYPTNGTGPEIIAPTPIVGGPNVLHLWANRT
ncbi:hypothetical protein PAXRUDRAFT_823669 [Paxillus rubicundulus Ve08.2h10]|uniref:Unplaced genomic scaffold scaffold_64, whole genome shotgun sequence n=1 Tax=Paxillus rubicundulus Ve08.2h10 TaxID=930991 RepID=A0A0D0E8M0_9AGAM|nr:hypothetical protein PAXRUDRAFT_823669 [Paxillus rubicundulus Ve08.2h10]